MGILKREEGAKDINNIYVRVVTCRISLNGSQQDVDILAVLDFLIPCSRPDTPGFILKMSANQIKRL